MRELVRAIDIHVDLVNLEVTRNLNAGMANTRPVEDIQAQLFAADHPIGDAPVQTAEDFA